MRDFLSLNEKIFRFNASIYLLKFSTFEVRNQKDFITISFHVPTLQISFSWISFFSFGFFIVLLITSSSLLQLKYIPFGTSIDSSSH